MRTNFAHYVGFIDLGLEYLFADVVTYFDTHLRNASSNSVTYVMPSLPLHFGLVIAGIRKPADPNPNMASTTVTQYFVSVQP